MEYYYGGIYAQTLQKTQKTAVRLVHKSKYKSHTEPLFKNLKLLKVEDLYTQTAIKFYYKYVNKTLPVYLLDIFRTTPRNHPYSTRNKHRESIPPPTHRSV